MNRRSVALFLLVCTLAAPAFGQVTLKRKFTEGAKHTTETIVTLNQTLTIAGMENTTEVETHLTNEESVGKRGADGKVAVTTTTKSMQVSIGGTAGDYQFDSVNPDKTGGSALEMIRDVHKMLAKRTTTTIYNKSNRVEEIKTNDADALASLPEQVKSMMKSQLDSDYLKEAANEQLDEIPTKAVKKGDTWERTSKADFGGGQTMEFKTKYTYEGTVDKGGRKLDKITAKTISVDFSLSEDSPLPIKLKSSKMAVKESSSEILFDRELGKVVQSKESVRVTGALTFEAMGQELPAELDLTMKSEAELKR